MKEDKYNGLPFEEGENRDDLNKALKLLKECYVGNLSEINVTYERRYVLFTRSQGEDESYKSYIAELEKRTRTCDFENVTPYHIIHDRIICGLRNKALHSGLLQEDNLSLLRCVELHVHVCQTSRAHHNASNWRWPVDYSASNTYVQNFV